MKFKDIFTHVFGKKIRYVQQIQPDGTVEPRAFDEEGNEIRFCDVCEVWHMDEPIHKSNCQKVAIPVEVIPDGIE